MPPSVHCADVLTSTGNHTPCGRSQALSASSTTPGSTVDGLRLRVVVEHAIEVLAVVDDQRSADRLPALRAARAARQHRDAELAADVERGAHVVVAARHQHADRHHLVDRGVGRSSGRATRGRTAPRPPPRRAGACRAPRRRRRMEASAAAFSGRIHVLEPADPASSHPSARRRTSRAGDRAECAPAAAPSRASSATTICLVLARRLGPLVVVEVGAEAQVLDAQVQRGVGLRKRALRAARLMRSWIIAVEAVVRRQVAARMTGEHLERASP